MCRESPWALLRMSGTGRPSGPWEEDSCSSRQAALHVGAVYASLTIGIDELRASPLTPRSLPLGTTLSRPRRPRTRACSPSGVHQTDDACIREAANAGAAVPPRSPWTRGRGSLGTRSITVGRDEVSVAGREWSGRPPLLPIAKRKRGKSATANFALCLSTSSTQPLRQAARDEPLLRLMPWIAANWRESVPPRSTQGAPGDRRLTPAP